MKNLWKKALPVGLSVALLTASASTALAANEASSPANQVPHQSISVIDEEIIEEKIENQFIGITGKIQDIESRDHGMQLIAVETNDGDPVHFIVSDESYVSDELQIGDEIIGFYDASLPMIMIYPPQLGAIAIAKVEEGKTSKVDFFDEQLVSSDGTLKLNLSEVVEIMNKDGSAFDGELNGHQLFVTYGASTKSIPAQTTPERVIVLAGPEESDVLHPEAPIGDHSDEADVDGVSYAQIDGEIEEIQPHGTDGKMQLVTVVQEDDSIVNLVISEQTYLHNELKEGMNISAFYDTNAPAILIHPPQYGAVAIAEVKESQSFKVDIFDEDLLSQDGSLKIRIGDNTKIIQQDGTPYEGDLSGRTLFVDYSIVQLSYPAQTSPDVIVVLNEREVETILKDTNSAEATEITSELSISVEDQRISVNGEFIEAPEALIDGEKIMLPLRAVAEAAGFEITWNNETKSSQLGDTISLKIGENTYTDAHGELVNLQIAPKLVDGLTYVPMDFFREVLHANTL